MPSMEQHAQIGNPAADPQAAGVEAIAVGHGLRFPDDLENIERLFEVGDALHAWCRLDVARDNG